MLIILPSLYCWCYMAFRHATIRQCFVSAYLSSTCWQIDGYQCHGSDLDARPTMDSAIEPRSPFMVLWLCHWWISFRACHDAWATHGGRPWSLPIPLQVRMSMPAPILCDLLCLRGPLETRGDAAMRLYQYAAMLVVWIYEVRLCKLDTHIHTSAIESSCTLDRTTGP